MEQIKGNQGTGADGRTDDGRHQACALARALAHSGVGGAEGAEGDHLVTWANPLRGAAADELLAPLDE